MIRGIQYFLVLLVLACFALPSWAAGGTLLVANKTDDTVDLIDLAKGKKRATLPTGHAPHEVAVSPDGALAAISNYGDRERDGTTLTLIDLRSVEVVRTIELGHHRRPHGMAWLPNGKLAVTTEGSAHLLVVDMAQGEIVHEISTGQRASHMLAVTPDGRRGFVANITSSSVTVVDLDEGTKTRDIATGAGSEGIAITPDGKEVWVSNRAAGTISIIDAETLAIVSTVPCPGFPIRVAITPDGKRALVSCAKTGEVVVFDVLARKELLRRKLDLSTVPTAKSRLFGDRFGDSPVPVGLVIAPDGLTAWVAATQADFVVVVDPLTLEVKNLLVAGQEPDGMAYSPIRVPKKNKHRKRRG